jgi:hypothetical protein
MTKTTKPQSRRLTKKAARELLSDTAWVKDGALSSQFSEWNVYTHPDGRIIHLSEFDQSGRIYPSREEFDELLKIIEDGKALGAQHVLAGRFPYGQDFPDHVPQLVDELATLLKIPRAELDNSYASLEKVDAKVRHIGRARSLEVPIFPALLAYVGEVMRAVTNGHWEMRLDVHYKTLEPLVVDPEGRICKPFLIVFDQLYEQHPFSIAGASLGEIYSRSVPPKPGDGWFGVVFTQIIPSDDKS